ncbi:chemotaxis protein CheA [Paracraurococcus lichenis]|uniref:histidine kinase n=1 Tax=Paracraurococcus lichenis TaxID=3064888 RepID=A0ABT9E6V3_9PROT|nr:chemotaxis protein CheA [Paracraurococcus sp. LOR1-02]MDO9711690.1 chemotaxis protein CheA [Paracraurococcus sp. LOR1-02]
MNPLLDQFLIEARELLDTASEGLLRMERGNGGAEMVNTVFRAVHTLKGTSGLFEVAPLTTLVHAAEDLLDAVRAQHLTLTGTMTDLLLGALDQTRAWLTTYEASEALPADAAAVAAERGAALRALLGGGASPATADAVDAGAVAGMRGWVAAFAPEQRAAAEAAARAADRDLVAVAYRPDPACFFRGEDPLHLLRQVPEVHALEVQQPDAWPSADTFDPFDCVLSFRLLSTAPPEELRHLFRYCEDVEIAAYAPPGAVPPDAATVQEVLDAQLALLRQPAEADAAAERAAAVAEVLRRIARHCGQRVDEAVLAKASEEAAAGRTEALAALLERSRIRPPPAPETGGAVHAPERPAVEVRPAGTATLRVDQAKIDTMMNLIGELIVAKNSLSYLARKAEAGASARELARDIKDQQAVVNRLAEDMQAAIMAIRMLPVSHVFQRFPRLVRDVARKLGKQVELVLEGEETEADKNMIEALADPLIHMVRNSLDHGLEPPEERIAAGKPPHGTVRLTAAQVNESIIVTIGDDGRGIDPDRMRRKAVERGMLDAEAAAALPDAEALRLIFAPGFSTAETISDLSGRGVGMDVVRSAVEKAGGWVAVDSQVGRGTTVQVTVPLSMAVARIMTIECAGHLFGIPMGAVVESVRLPASAVHHIRDREAFVLRDRIVPLLRLARLLDLPGEAAASQAIEDAPVLVLRVGQATVGLVIDAFRERMEAIVRPLEGVLAGLRGFAGTTLLGDGRVLLILDVAELI